MKGYELKKCFYCSGKIVRKNGVRNGKQLYKCYCCGRQFLGGFRLSGELLWQEWQAGKQTYSQLAVKYGCSIKTIQRKIDSYTINHKATTPCHLIDGHYLLGSRIWSYAVQGFHYFRLTHVK